MHKNLFHWAGSRSEVYDCLQRDMKRDSRKLQIMDLILVALVIYLVWDMPKLDAAAILLFVTVCLSRLNFFIDQSNRNFMMHLIDWNNAGPDDQQGLR